LEQFKETDSVLHRKGASRPSVDPDTVIGVHEVFNAVWGNQSIVVTKN